MLYGKTFFDFEDGDFAHSISDNMAIDFDGDLLMRTGDNMAMDYDKRFYRSFGWVVCKLNFRIFEECFKCFSLIQSITDCSACQTFGQSSPLVFFAEFEKFFYLISRIFLPDICGFFKSVFPFFPGFFGSIFSSAKISCVCRLFLQVLAQQWAAVFQAQPH